MTSAKSLARTLIRGKLFIIYNLCRPMSNAQRFHVLKCLLVAYGRAKPKGSTCLLFNESCRLLSFGFVAKMQYLRTPQRIKYCPLALQGRVGLLHSTKQKGSICVLLIIRYTALRLCRVGLGLFYPANPKGPI